MDKGVLLRFDVPLDAPSAANPDNYSLTSWHYKRTYQVRLAAVQGGRHAGHRPAGAEPRLPFEGSARACSSACRSMKPVMQMRVGWSLDDGGRARRSRRAPTSRRTSCRSSIRAPKASATSPSTCRRGPLAANRDRAGERRGGPPPVSALRLHRLPRDRQHARSPGSGRPGKDCTAASAPMPRACCGPSPTTRICVSRSSNRRRRSWRATSAARSGMPSYAGVLTDRQIESLILFIKSLK